STPDSSTYLHDTIIITNLASTLQIRFRNDNSTGKRLRDVVITGFESNLPCSITDSRLAHISCFNNDTPLDTSDDITSFELNPTGTALGATYSVDMDGIAFISTNINGPFNSDVISGINYGEATTFYLEPGSA